MKLNLLTLAAAILALSLLLIFGVLIPLQLVRARKEERALTRKFGAAYLEYKKKSWL
jgi:protein-S-isoprenylcysteine O-methyltransferase Ste14